MASKKAAFRQVVLPVDHTHEKPISAVRSHIIDDSLPVLFVLGPSQGVLRGDVGATAL
jgi:hypothetical protein